MFHSEADFQFALAWQIQLLDPELHIRLETRLGATGRLDMLIAHPDRRRQTAIELNYPTAKWSGTVTEERFVLAENTAPDAVRYDVLKDITRVEGYVDSDPSSDGAAIVLTNAPTFWCPPPQASTANDLAFRIHEGAVLEGTKAWGPKASAGTTKDREMPVKIRGTYQRTWNPYSAVEGLRGEFRILVIPVTRRAIAGTTEY